MATSKGLHPETLHNESAERERTQKLAERYRVPFIDLSEQRIDPELFRSIPAELMFRYNFVPLESHDHSLTVVVADPSQMVNDELTLLLGKKINIKEIGRASCRE